MSATDTATSLRALPKNLITGAAAGVVAGIPLGIIMQVRDADPKMMTHEQIAATPAPHARPPPRSSASTPTAACCASAAARSPSSTSTRSPPRPAGR